ncbi:uncharacterized protein LOC110737941 [Chenopodium quinoa]|uniref:uncharacterized protein LOC110737941 n=1 Tax=Chenopodium quinoa TaxID=63459 RepID=UPI000B787E45|nr:uncharacterized protein LOC110737941 [Chenopodium quinoa]
MVSERGINANPEKVEAVLSLLEPKCTKDIMRLIRRLVALTRFISKSADKALLFYQLLKGNREFKWGEEEKKAFVGTKEHLTKLPTMISLEQGEKLQLYISSSTQTIGAVLLVERNKQQRPVYFAIHHWISGKEVPHSSSGLLHHEAEPTKYIATPQVRTYIWKNIITRFGVPQCIVVDHGCQFDYDTIKDYLEELNIMYASASVCHPQSNGQAEAMNKLILTALERKLEEHKGLWADLVPEVLWANRTTEKEATGKSPFALAYGADVIVPVEVQIPSLRIQHYEQQGNEKRLLEELDFLLEIRLKAALKQAAQKSKISKAFKKRVKH